MSRPDPGAAPLADVAGAALAELRSLNRQGGRAIVEAAAPALLDIVGYAAAEASGGRVRKDEVRDLLLDTERRIAAWIADPAATPEDPPRSDHPLGRLEIPIPRLASLIVLATGAAAAEASDGGSEMLHGLVVGLVVREAAREMLGGLMAGIRDEPIPVAEVDDLLGEAAASLSERDEDGPGDCYGDTLEGYA